MFANPLEPFFHEPMSAETFAKFKQQVEGERRISTMAGTIYNAAVFVQLESLKQRWPLGFPDTGGSWSLPRGMLFRYSPQSYFLRWSARPPSDGHFGSFDVTKNVETVQPPASDEKATESWRLKPKGDIRFDLATRSLVAMPGAKMATLDETHWYALDRIPTADLRRRLAEAPIESYSLAKLPSSLTAGDLEAQGLPTFVVQTIAGGIVLMRIEHYTATDLSLGIRPRPLAAYPPFLAVEEAAEPKPAVDAPVEFFLGESEPGEGLKEAKVDGESGRLIYLHEEPVLTQADIAQARADVDSNGKPTVFIKFTEAGAAKMGKATADNLRKQLAVVVDGEVISTAIIRSKISDRAQITGSFSEAYVARLAHAIDPSSPLEQDEAAAASGEPAAFSSDRDRLRQIGLAMQNYHDVRKHFPDAAIRNVEGKPLLSCAWPFCPILRVGSNSTNSSTSTSLGTASTTASSSPKCPTSSAASKPARAGPAFWHRWAKTSPSGI